MHTYTQKDARPAERSEQACLHTYIHTHGQTDITDYHARHPVCNPSAVCVGAA